MMETTEVNGNQFKFLDDIAPRDGAHGTNYVDVFVTPGKYVDADHVGELLMRTVFDSRDEMMAAVKLYSKCRRCGNDDGLYDLMLTFQGKVSINGRSTILATQVATNAVSPEALQLAFGNTGKGGKTIMGRIFNRRNNGANNPDNNNASSYQR